MADLGHRRLTLLKLDCEGCEWGVLARAASWLPFVDQLVLEMHFAANYQVHEREDVALCAAALRAIRDAGLVRVQLNPVTPCRKDSDLGSFNFVHEDLEDLACAPFLYTTYVRLK